MNLFKLAAPLALAFAFAACTDGDSNETGDTGSNDTGETDTGSDFYDGAPEITDATYDCGVTTSGYWTYGVRTKGWADAGVSMNIYQTGAYADGTDNGWHEAGHEYSQGDVAGTDFDPNGEWDQWGLALEVTATAGDVAPGTALKTLYSCDLYTPGEATSSDLAWRIYAYDDDDNDPGTAGVASDCWDFGFQPEEIAEIGSADSLCHAP